MKEPYLLLRTRIFFAMILLVFVSFLLIGITTSFQIRDNSLYYHELRLDRKEAQLQRAFNILLMKNLYSQTINCLICSIEDLTLV